MLVCPKLFGLCSVSEANGSKGMELDIAGLDTAGRDELLEQWRSLIGRPPPKLVTAILDGTTGQELTIKKLSARDIPLNWEEQHAKFLC